MQMNADYARALDEKDELARFRNEFVIADPNVIYLDGNSLGRLARRSASRLREVVENDWATRLVRGWSEGWFGAAERIGAKVAKLVGAEPDEVIVADSTSVNLFKLVVAALKARPGRRTIVTDNLNFPSDLYVLKGAIEFAGPEHKLTMVRSADSMTVPIDQLAAGIDADTALVALTHTCFKSGFMYDLAQVTSLAHGAGALALWDLCHSVGVTPLDLSAAGVDLAVGCTYKYLNGGPGAPAFLFVRRELQEQLRNPIWGWFGHRDPFAFALDYEPAAGITRFLSGTPPILALESIEPGVDLVLEAGIERIRDKSVRQTEYLIALWEEQLRPFGASLNSPRDSAQRGSHVAFGHPDGLRVARALIDDMQVIPDFRAPDNIRLGVAPLYTSFSELHAAVQRFRQVLSDRLYEKYSRDRPSVT